jgi:ferredoxin-type protein NapH
MATEINFSISQPHPDNLGGLRKIGLALVAIGLAMLAFSFSSGSSDFSGWYLGISMCSILIGTGTYAYGLYMWQSPGIKNDRVWMKDLSNRGTWAWIAGIVLTTFYILLYWFPSWIGLGTEETGNRGFVAMFDPLSMFLKGKVASQWFAYGVLYTLAILALGFKFILKYRHSRYHIWRTIVLMICQLFLAFLIPEILEGLNQEQAYFAKDLKFFWPLNYYFFEDWHLNAMAEGGSMGMFYLVWGIALFLIVTPVLTYFLGKRWYCSWVCGCGGLAETAGDPFRHLSDKRLSAWKLERWLIHGVLVYIFVVTAVVLYGYFSNQSQIFGIDIYTWFRRPYGFLIGAAFSGVIGVGFYPLLGSRVWCRFGCPLAAYMGIFQRFKSRFRITTNGGQCISCGNCSTYCEQGIDVRWYAQRGQNIVRSSCVGCGVCSSVCPRGVLKLENGPEQDRINDKPILIGRDDVRLL